MDTRREEDVLSGFDFSALPPVSTFEYHPANYQVMQQKLNLIKMQQLLGSIKPETNKPISHQHFIYNNNNNIEKLFEEPPIMPGTKNTVNTASSDFKPFFPDYTKHMAQIRRENVVVNKISQNKQRQEETYDSENSALLKLLNFPSNVKDFDKFLDTKTVVAGVDIVEN